MNHYRMAVVSGLGVSVGEGMSAARSPITGQSITKGGLLESSQKVSM
jgi:hypothetical protein